MVVVIIITTPRVGPRAVRAVEGGRRKEMVKDFVSSFLRTPCLLQEVVQGKLAMCLRERKEWEGKEE